MDSIVHAEHDPRTHSLIVEMIAKYYLHLIDIMHAHWQA